MKRFGNGKCGGGSGLADGDGLRIEIIRSFSEQVLRDIVAAYRKAMPWQFSDDADYFREMLHDKECVHVLLRKGGASAGYLLAKPQVAAARDAELLEADPQFIPDPDRYYVETMEIAPELRNTLAGGRMFFRMLHAMIDEVGERFGINKFSMHVRVGNGASEAVQRYFGRMISPVRRIANWRFYNGEDAADYLEGTYERDNSNASVITKMAISKNTYSNTLPSVPSPQGRGDCQVPSPLGGEGKGEGELGLTYAFLSNKERLLRKYDEIYTPLEEAKEEVWRRWNDEGLRSKINAFLGEMPEVLHTPRASLFRHIITPNYEYLRFARLSQEVNLLPLGVEYLEDKFCYRNPDKVSLVRIVFCPEKNNGLEIVTSKCKNIINLRAADKKSLNEIRVFSGEALAEFHHRLLRWYATAIEIYDASPWYKSHGKKAYEYYKYFLALFICHGILFENFITNREEERFAKTVVMPAYREVMSIFGLKPLIVQLLPPETAGDDYWRSYPAELLEEVNKCLAKISSQTLCT